MVERRAQALDLALAGLDRGMEKQLSDLMLRVSGLAAQLRPPERLIAAFGADLGNYGGRLDQAISTFVERRGTALESASRLLSANSFERVLDRGFALVTTPDGRALKRAGEVPEGADVTIRFADASRTARMDGASDPSAPTPAAPTPAIPDRAAPKKKAAKQGPSGPKDSGQDSLF